LNQGSGLKPDAKSYSPSGARLKCAWLSMIIERYFAHLNLTPYLIGGIAEI